jgi:hypothetical protein
LDYLSRVQQGNHDNFPELLSPLQTATDSSETLLLKYYHENQPKNNGIRGFYLICCIFIKGSFIVSPFED